ncbi:MDR family MFS transporter [Alicyclobacillus tolerans]|uniref:Predicted arabinose efflux permease, MFS family n=1 Tax=Alicyclobacillus tolerans TaxID=90970 RepID=A0A1M6VYS2_9BACL|nr:MFS transporter [Alicyclobacillus montanus]SHK86583.1 Predicted arabinose efflux permease, MFS family [Alicyclobacillus montanus]
MDRWKKRALGNVPLVLWLLALACFINVGGLSLLWPVNSIYIHVKLHQSMAVAGFVLMVYSGAGFIGSLLGGWCYDRFGPVLTLAGSSFLAAISILLPVFYQHFAVYVGVMAVFGVLCAVPFPVLNALAGHAWPEAGRKAFNFLYVSNNVGVAIGTAIGGFIAAHSFDTVFYGIFLSYLLFVILTLTVFRRPFQKVYQHRSVHGHESIENVASRLETASIPWGAIGILLAGFIVTWSVYVQWQSTISVDMQALGYPLSAYSILWTINGALIFLGQPVVSFVVRRVPSLTVHMVGGVIGYILAFLLLALSHDYIAFLLAMLLTTFSEMFVWPSVPAAIAQLSPPRKLGFLQGLVSSGATFGRMIGPFYGGYMYDRDGINGVLHVSLLLLVLPIFLFLLFHVVNRPGRIAERREVS